MCCTSPFWGGSFFLFCFCLPSLRCLISALTQAGGGDLLSRFASSVLLRGGRGSAGSCRCVWGALAVFWPGRQGLGLTLPGCGRLFPPGRAAQGARGSGGLSPGAVRLFPSLPQHALPVGCLRLAFVQRSWSLDTTLPVANVDHPESQEVFR